jgi:hypothetical protein
MDQRPRCAYCDKLAPKLCTTVYIRSHTTPVQQDGRWYRYIRTGLPPTSIAECRSLSNQEVVAVKYGIDSRVSQFSEWDGESYWLAKDPCCTIDCLQRYAAACQRAGYRMQRATEEAA